MKNKPFERQKHILDAENISFGRLAVKAAFLLRGKHKTDFSPNVDNGDFVVIENSKKIKVTGRKMKDKIYRHHTGFIGNLKEIAMKDLIAKKGEREVLRRAVLGMLPKNKLRPQMIKRLTFK